VFCYPSRAERGEGLSIAPLEAMAAGAVPVLSRLACYRDLLVDGRNGLTFDHTAAQPAHALAACLAQLLGRADLRRRLGTQAQEDARPHDFAATSACLLREFARLTGPSGGS
jgi:glycosyltransferase involved in cell wall biosynthesis